MSVDAGRTALNTLAIAAGARQAPDNIETAGAGPFAVTYVQKIESKKMPDTFIVTYRVEFHVPGEMTGRAILSLQTVAVAFLTALVNNTNVLLSGSVDTILYPVLSQFGASMWAGIQTWSCAVEVPVKIMSSW